MRLLLKKNLSVVVVGVGVDGKVLETKTVEAGNVLLVTISVASTGVEGFFFFKHQRVIPRLYEDLFDVLTSPKFCWRNEAGEIVCMKFRRFYPAPQIQEANLMLRFCPVCGHSLEGFKDADLPVFVPAPVQPTVTKSPPP
ncbi:MAG: hypothetical protein A3I32_03345 [Candidatus Yanofskybacteria bacterium RIFCSPLOWO2_02_FULL_45_10]|uniref:Uncharacterized protein n=2 Tax=Candidatus Yanofskyibacteriota TaxID=1752733 RepID=A0A1F8G3I7_9BACT|nr:MAG: hypothetical protein A3F25_01955 [Candidatus Yanofskybacteria bacterium RIFCSPHIGHO2_12_FULL_45_19b]OGN32708.1 MAG: hypothetical protein A3I32_03345 [Candidatus Yanofskybacteria bacterium RIFCSPLOWO2_02_FULL_45_10]